MAFRQGSQYSVDDGRPVLQVRVVIERNWTGNFGKGARRRMRTSLPAGRSARPGSLATMVMNPGGQSRIVE